MDSSNSVDSSLQEESITQATDYQTIPNPRISSNETRIISSQKGLSGRSINPYRRLSDNPSPVARLRTDNTTKQQQQQQQSSPPMLYRQILKVRHSKSFEQQQQQSMDSDTDQKTAAVATLNVSHKQGYDEETKLTPKMSAKRPRDAKQEHKKRVSVKKEQDYDEDDEDDDGNYTDTTTNDDPDRGPGHSQQQDPFISKDKDSMTASSTTPDTSKKNKVNWKKPIDMPKRPLSAYNLFFKSQRQQLLGTDATQYPITDQAKRKHRKTHGKIGFEEMAKNVGQKWKDLDEETKSYFEREAAIEKEKYNAAMEEYNKKKRQGSTATTTTLATGGDGMEGADGSSAQVPTPTAATTTTGLDSFSMSLTNQQQQQQPFLGALSSLGIDRYLGGETSLNTGIFSGLSETTSSIGLTASGNRIFLDDTSLGMGSSSRSGGLSNRFFDSSTTLGRALQRQNDRTDAALDNDTFAQMMLLAEDPTRSVARRSTIAGGTGGLGLGSSAAARAEAVADLANPQERLSGSEQSSYLGSGLSLRGSLGLVSSPTVNTSSSSFIDRRRSSSIVAQQQQQQLSDEDLWEYYRYLLQEAMVVRDELDRRMATSSLLSSSLGGSAQGNRGTGGFGGSGSSGLSSLGGNARGLFDRGSAGLPLPLYDDINMPPMSSSQNQYERQAELVGRARQVQSHLQQQQQQQLRHASAGSLLQSLENRLGRRLSDSQRSNAASLLLQRQQQQQQHPPPSPSQRHM